MLEYKILLELIGQGGLGIAALYLAYRIGMKLLKKTEEYLNSLRESNNKQVESQNKAVKDLGESHERAITTVTRNNSETLDKMIKVLGVKR